VFILLIVIVLLIDVLAIVMFLRDALKPVAFLIMNGFQTSFWAVVLVLELAAIGKGAGAAGIGFTVFILYGSLSNCARSAC
jgi:hypothetical protein